MAHRSAGTALITGASSGIGLELAKQFAAHGHDVVLVARSRDALEALAGQLEGKHGITATVIVSDLSEPEAPAALFESTQSAGIHVEYLVNNAGFGLRGAFADTDLERELDMIQVNAAVVVHLTKLYLGPMLRRKSGRILNVASTAGFQPGPLHSIYYATKAFVLSFSQAIDEELRNTGVSVSCLCPGPVSTGFAQVAGATESRLFKTFPADAAEDVARYGYRALMRGERVAIPGVKNKLMVQAERLTPRAVVTFLARKVQEDR